MCDKIVDDGYVRGFVDRWRLARDPEDCPKIGVVGYLDVLANFGKSMCTLGDCVTIESFGSYYVLRAKDYPVVPIYYCVDDANPQVQLQYAGKNVVWKNVVVRNDAIVTCPMPTRLVPIGGTEFSYLFIVLEKCGNLPMPVYTYANDKGPQSLATEGMLAKYPLYGMYDALGSCPTCAGNWTWNK